MKSFVFVFALFLSTVVHAQTAAQEPCVCRAVVDGQYPLQPYPDSAMPNMILLERGGDSGVGDVLQRFPVAHPFYIYQQGTFARCRAAAVEHEACAAVTEGAPAG
jgi:hypothetical protein